MKIAVVLLLSGLTRVVLDAQPRAALEKGKVYFEE